jgi:hypothetical protein
MTNGPTTPPTTPPNPAKPDLALVGTPTYDASTDRIIANFANKGTATAGAFVATMRLWTGSAAGETCNISFASLAVNQKAFIACDTSQVPPCRPGWQ